MKFRDIFNFDKMLTPLIIKILYYLGIAGSVIGGIVVFFGGVIGAFTSDNGFISFVGGILGGALIIFVGILTTRISSESTIVRFQINQNLAAIKNKMVDGEKPFID